MKASSLTPWSKVALCVLACMCFLAYQPRGAEYPSIVAPPKPEDAFSAEDRHAAEDRHTTGDRYGTAPRTQQAAEVEEEETKAAAPGFIGVEATAPGGAEEERHGSLRSRERKAQDTMSPADEGASSGAVTGQLPASSEQCWIFMHLQKCGGTTVKDMLQDSWGSRYFRYETRQWKVGDNNAAKLSAKLARGSTWNVMAGGYTEALRRSEPVAADCRFFTLFRHPITRMVSAYFYCKSSFRDPACASEVVQAKHVDLLTFAKHWGNFALRQFVLSFVPSDDVQEYIRTPEAQALRDFDLKKVAGWYQLKLYLERPQKDGGVSAQSEAVTVQQDAAATPDAPLYDLLQPAMDVIRHGYVAVGILEEWNTTLHLFDHALEMPVMNWGAQFAEAGKRNVDNRNKRLQEETLRQAWTDSELKKYMRLDLLLYKHAVDIFHQQARGYGLL